MSQSPSLSEAADATSGVAAHGRTPTPTSTTESSGTNSPLASLVRGAAALFSTQPLTWTASLVAIILAPRYLGSDGLGQIALVLSISGYVAVVASLGVPDYLTRHVATHRTSAAIESGRAVVFLTLISVIVAAIAFVGAPLLGLRLPRGLFVVALAGTVTGTAQSVILSLLRGQERLREYAWLNAANVVVGVGASVAVLVAGGGVLAYATTLFVVSLGGLLVGWYRSGVRVDRSAFSIPRWRELARGGLPFLGWIMMVRVQGAIDIPLLAWFTEDAVVGWYAAAYRIISFPMFIPTLIITPLLPVLSRCAGDEATLARTLQRSVTVVTLFMVPMCAMIAALAPVIPGVLGWGPDFDGAVTPMVILAIQAPLTAINMVFGIALLALHREKAWFRVTAVAAIANPALNLVAIPFFQRTAQNGAIGAALVTVVTECLLLAGAVWLLPRAAIRGPLLSTCLRTILAAVALVVVVVVVRQLSWPLAVVVGGGVFVGLIPLLRIVRMDDLLAGLRLAHPALARRFPKPIAEL